MLIHDNVQPPKKRLKSAPTPCSKRMTLKLMKMERRFILLGISLADLKVKSCLESLHCL